MVEILRMSKPTEKGGVILPADFRQYFGYGWDMLYGTFVLTALCLVTWLKLDSNFYLLLIVTYVDVFVVFDTLLSIYICSYQLVQIMYVNRVIEVCCIALQRLFHLTTQLLLCAPFLFFLLALKYPVAATLYKVLCIFRTVNLLMPERKSFSSSIRTTLNEEFELSQATKRLNVLSLGDYCDHRRRKNFGMLQKLRARRKYS